MKCSGPKTKGYSGNYCAFCHYWEGNADLHSYGSSLVEFDERAKGICLKTRNSRNANASACQKFEMNNEANRYCR